MGSANLSFQIPEGGHMEKQPSRNYREHYREISAFLKEVLTDHHGLPALGWSPGVAAVLWLRISASLLEFQQCLSKQVSVRRDPQMIPS